MIVVVAIIAIIIISIMMIIAIIFGESRTRGVARIPLGLKPSRDSRATSQRDSPIWIQPLGVFRYKIHGLTGSALFDDPLFSPMWEAIMAWAPPKVRHSYRLPSHAPNGKLAFGLTPDIIKSVPVPVLWYIEYVILIFGSVLGFTRNTLQCHIWHIFSFDQN